MDNINNPKRSRKCLRRGSMKMTFLSNTTEKNVEEQIKINEQELEKKQLEKERLEKERLYREEQEQLEKEKLVKEQLEKEKLEQDRLLKERLEKERLEKERLEKERLEKERIEEERIEKERLEKAKQEKERLEKERLEKERIEKERLEKERLEKERIEKERLEKERLVKANQEKEKLEKEKLQKERLQKEIILNSSLKKCIVAVIPVFGREPLLKYTIRRLYKKNKINHVIVLGDSDSERRVAVSENAIFIKHQNRPLGKKWNAGFMYAKRFNPDALLFVGSSDWISSDWIDRAYIEILNGAGYVGKKDFDMVDISKKNIKYCKWFGYVCDRKYETIGIGRLVSKKLLEAINYSPFPDEKDNSMDYGMYLLCKEHRMTVKILENNSIFLSISCDLWKNMHEFNMHYYAPIDDKYYSKDRSGCVNVRDNKNVSGGKLCDIHSKHGCHTEISNFWHYNDLYKNGRIYTNKDILILNKEFPELTEFYNDYLKLFEKNKLM